MRKILFPLQKLAIAFFYFEMLLDLDKVTYSVLSLLLLLSSLKLEGARAYTPLIFAVVMLELLGFQRVQVVLIILVGVISAIFKVYDISVPMKGPYLMGHRYQYVQKEDGSMLQLSFFYPTLTRGTRVEWIPKRDYNKVLYEIFHVDPAAKALPYWIFTFIVSYIHKLYMPAQGNSPYLSDSELSSLEGQSRTNPNKQKVMIFSHGLGSHLNAYSSMFAAWASNGYTIVSINHDKDEVRLDYRVASKDDPQIIKDYIFDKRHRDLNIRVSEMLAVYEQLRKPEFVKQAIGVDIQFKQIMLAGHSYGGGTALATKSHLNRKYKQKPADNIVSSLLCFDPWLFPFDLVTFNNLHNEHVLVINSEHFYKDVPYIYNLEKRYVKLKERNPTAVAVMVKGMDHIAQGDSAYVFGNILQLTGSIKLHRHTDNFQMLNLFIVDSFLQGKTKEQILEESNRFVEARKMDMDRIEVKEEYRVSRHITFGKDKPEDVKEFVDKIKDAF